MPLPVLDALGKYGVRGQAILLCALIWATLGVNALLPLQNPPAHGLMHYIVPRAVLRFTGLPYELADVSRAVVWIVPAFVALFSANHTRRSSTALGVLYVPAIGYALSYVGSFVMWACFGPEEGNYRGLTTAVLYGALCLLIRIVARIPAHAEEPLTGPPLIPSVGPQRQDERPSGRSREV